MSTEDNENLPAKHTEEDQSVSDLITRAVKSLSVKPTKAAQRLLKGLFRVILMSSDTLLERYVTTKGRLGDANRDIRQKDILLNLRKKEADTWLDLLKRDQDIPVDRFSDLETLSRRMNAARIVTRALELSQHEPVHSDESDSEISISSAWFDRFLQFASTKNEPWREDVLAVALAREASIPGSISLRALWSLVMLEDKEFKDLSDFVNLSAKLYRDGLPLGFYMVGYYAQLIKSDYVRYDHNNGSISDLFDRLEAIELFSLGHGDIDLMKANEYKLEMGSVSYAISMAKNPPKDLADTFLEGQNSPPFGREDEVENDKDGRYSLHAMPLTRAGNEIAELLDWKPSEQAIKRFEEALQQQGENLKAVGLN